MQWLLQEAHKYENCNIWTQQIGICILSPHTALLTSFRSTLQANNRCGLKVVLQGLIILVFD